MTSFCNRFLKGFLSSSTGTAATVLIHFFSIVFIVKQAPVEDFGLYMLLLALVHGLRILAGLGLDLTLVKFISSEKSENNRAGLRSETGLCPLGCSAALHP